MEGSTGSVSKMEDHLLQAKKDELEANQKRILFLKEENKRLEAEHEKLSAKNKQLLEETKAKKRQLAQVTQNRQMLLKIKGKTVVVDEGQKFAKPLTDDHLEETGKLEGAVGGQILEDDKTTVVKIGGANKAGGGEGTLASRMMKSKAKHREDGGNVRARDSKAVLEKMDLGKPNGKSMRAKMKEVMEEKKGRKSLLDMDLEDDDDEFTIMDKIMNHIKFDDSEEDEGEAVEPCKKLAAQEEEEEEETQPEASGGDAKTTGVENTEDLKVTIENFIEKIVRERMSKVVDFEKEAKAAIRREIAQKKKGRKADDEEGLSWNLFDDNREKCKCGRKSHEQCFTWNYIQLFMNRTLNVFSKWYPQLSLEQKKDLLQGRKKKK